MAGEYAAWFEQLPVQIKDLYYRMPTIADSETLDSLPPGTVIQARTTNAFDAFTGSCLTLVKNGEREWKVLDILGTEVVDRGWGVAEPVLPVVMVRMGYLAD